MTNNQNMAAPDCDTTETATARGEAPNEDIIHEETMKRDRFIIGKQIVTDEILRDSLLSRIAREAAGNDIYRGILCAYFYGWMNGTRDERARRRQHMPL